MAPDRLNKNPAGGGTVGVGTIGLSTTMFTATAGVIGGGGGDRWCDKAVALALAPLSISTFVACFTAPLPEVEAAIGPPRSSIVGDGAMDQYSNATLWWCSVWL